MQKTVLSVGEWAAQIEQRLERIEGFVWATMQGVRESSELARMAIDNNLELAQRMRVLIASKPGTESTCETTGRERGDGDD